ncbi:C1QL [Mytilus coruscus]|uniref:C1QL n=1 Tax=Mytilus coruscus TaxID=42192 RepID=A0A6J8AA08_MYTCO|nr:C1QL [Mytilus coruscus]
MYWLLLATVFVFFDCVKCGCCDSCPMYADLKAEIDDLKAANIPVAFYAYLSGNLAISSVSTHSIIKYDVVNLNLGNGYDASSGQFIAPSDGLYVFHITTGSRDSSHAVVELISNGVIKDITWADSMDHKDRAVATTVTPLNLRKGDTVNARIGLAKGGAVLESTTHIRCSFSGFKVH